MSSEHTVGRVATEAQANSWWSVSVEFLEEDLGVKMSRLLPDGSFLACLRCGEECR